MCILLFYNPSVAIQLHCSCDIAQPAYMKSHVLQPQKFTVYNTYIIIMSLFVTYIKMLLRNIASCVNTFYYVYNKEELKFLQISSQHVDSTILYIFFIYRKIYDSISSYSIIITIYSFLLCFAVLLLINTFCYTNISIYRILEYPHVSYSFVLLKEILWEGSYLLPYVNGILTLYKYTQDIGVPTCQLSVCVVKRDSTGGQLYMYFLM